MSLNFNRLNSYLFMSLMFIILFIAYNDSWFSMELSIRNLLDFAAGIIIVIVVLLFNIISVRFFIKIDDFNFNSSRIIDLGNKLIFYSVFFSYTYWLYLTFYCHGGAYRCSEITDAFFFLFLFITTIISLIGSIVIVVQMKKTFTYTSWNFWHSFFPLLSIVIFSVGLFIWMGY